MLKRYLSVCIETMWSLLIRYNVFKLTLIFIVNLGGSFLLVNNIFLYGNVIEGILGIIEELCSQLCGSICSYKDCANPQDTLIPNSDGIENGISTHFGSR